MSLQTGGPAGDEDDVAVVGVGVGVGVEVGGTSPTLYSPLP